MEPKVSSSQQARLFPPDCVSSDPEEKELSDEDDDDRNHKHRRRETRSQSLERDSMEQVYARPYRKHNKPFENGHPSRENESQASESWKSYNMSSLEKDFTAKCLRKRPGLTSLSRAPLDLNQRMRVHQTYYGDSGPARGRGRDSGSWNQRDSRFSTVDFAAQMVQPVPVAPSLFAGRGLPNVSNSQSAPWSAYGLIPSLPNGGLDTFHSIGLQGTLRPPLSSSLNLGITRQRCRDFEERGFCLRGDMCPMEHGVNRIVVEDVQSLSQFNLTVPLPNAPLLATPAGPGPLPSVGAPSTTLMGNKGAHNKVNKPGITDDSLGLNGAYSDSANADGADLYDPDQPLWNNNGPETSTLAALQSSNEETEPLLNGDSSDHHHVRFGDGVDNECPMRIAGSAAVSQGTNPSVWVRIGGKNRSIVKEKIDVTLSPSDYLENETKEGKDVLSSLHGAFRRGKRSIDEDAGSKVMDASAKLQIDTMHNIRKPSQKALRTLFVNGIPQKHNRREALFSHFRKFGEVVDIYIPLNSERAFVQFSKREEAEAALKAPDAVMGNRFIKLWWANRDSIPDDGISSGTSTSLTPRGVTAASVPAHLSVANKVTDNNLQSAAVKGSTTPASDISLPACDHSSPVISNSPKVPPLQKKLDSLEQLKEELRKKQELLDQKRNDFRRKLDKLEKQSGGVKGDLGMEQAAKKPKVGVATDLAEGAGRSSGPGATVASPSAEMVADKNKIVDTVVYHSPKSSTAMVLHESTSFKQHIRPLTPVGPPFLMNRYKLDNRPTAFRIVPPLPAGLADVAVLKEHFSSYGDLSAVELEGGELHEGVNGLDSEKNCSARIAFTTRRSAERAFQNGKCWQGHNLQFMWLMSSGSGNDLGNRENSSSTLKGSSDADVQQEEKSACNLSQEGRCCIRKCRIRKFGKK
ncbi:zinc finger CCCH domain-containing protein 41 isoform X2 [Mangifera indica]|uniref:zinc finger CCCH domain-containing protein 41 isoform X2 n=1 Tax=Mangifera indica TaxID=29780 RepID=UPI001CF93405|nr:zinc finger CCCH domain-containing protein 41 isoform X2 [Mangifera indica]